MITCLPREIIDVYTPIAEDRSHLYQLLNIAYRYPGDDVMGELRKEAASGLLDKIGKMYLSAPSTMEIIESFKSNINTAGSPYELQVEYTRLFIGPSHLPAPPYESVYMADSRGFLMGNSAQAVMKLYREEGLALSPSISDLPDHILAELEFMSYLSEREASAWENNVERVEHYLKKQDTFLTDHLTKWLPPFAHGIRSASGQGMYRALVGLTESFIVLDHDYIKALMKGLDTMIGKRDDGNSL